jgi:hypothetical protein
VNAAVIEVRKKALGREIQRVRNPALKNFVQPVAVWQDAQPTLHGRFEEPVWHRAPRLDGGRMMLAGILSMLQKGRNVFYAPQIANGERDSG